MLHLLQEYARNKGMDVETGFKPKEVRWSIAFDEAGNYEGIVELGAVTQSRNPGRHFPKCPELSFSEMKAGGVTKCHFLVETAEVVALLGKNSDDQKINDKHDYFTMLLAKAGEILPALSRAATTLQSTQSLSSIKSDLETRKVKPTEKVTLRIGNSFPLELVDCQDWWRNFRGSLGVGKGEEKSTSTADSMRCFVTGQLVEPTAVSPPIEGLSDVGGLPTGDRLVSFKQESFCSYGLEQSANAAMSEEAASAYRLTLNHLIKNHSSHLAGAKVVHWFKKEILPEDDPLPWLEEMTQDDEGKSQERDAKFLARQLLKSIRTGKKPELQGNYYYALTLSGASGRVMVRDWMEGQFEELVENIALWFDDFEIVHREGGRSAHPPKFLAVLGATVRDLDDLAAPFVAKMWRVAVRGELVPETALAKAVARTRVDIIEDKSLNHARMGLMKAYHVRKDRINRREQMMTSCLNEQHPSAAYHCGRLMAVMAALQRAALGDVGAGVVQRYYAAASTTPALVIGRLVRTSQFHLNKLEGGLAHWYEDKLAGISCNIGDNIPSTLTLEEQSLFALGYYQQLAARPDKDTEDITDEKENTNE